MINTKIEQIIIEYYKQMYKREQRLQKYLLVGNVALSTLAGGIFSFGAYKLFSANDTRYITAMAISALVMLGSYTHYSKNKISSKEKQDVVKRKILNLGGNIDDLV